MAARSVSRSINDFQLIDRESRVSFLIGQLLIPEPQLQIDYWDIYPYLFHSQRLYSALLNIESIGSGQREAVRSTGLNAWQTQVYMVLPKALRNVSPNLVSNTIAVVKLTSLASVVAFAESLYSSEMARSDTYNALPLVMAAAMYLVLLWPAVRLANRLVHRLAPDQAATSGCS